MTGNGNGAAPSNTVTRVVIADDHPTIHAGLATLIHAEKPHWEICPAAADGREAIVRATELRPDIMIMDCTMPHVNGLEATGEIHRALPGIEVLIFTGAHCRHILAGAFHSKARGCLLKSEGPEALLPALESVRHHHRFRSRGFTEVCDDISAASRNLGTLTGRERETACLIAQGSSTIETHRVHIFAKLQVHCVAELVRLAVRIGLVPL